MVECDHFHNDKSNGCVKIWIQLSAFPFSYWLIRGIYQFARSRGKCISFYNDPLAAANNNEPKSYGTLV